MKNKKRNYYIIAFITFILVLVFIDLYLEGSVAEFFVRTLLEDTEEVIFAGVPRIRGTFRWDRLKDILIFVAVGGFLTLEFTIYIFTKNARNHERLRVIEEIGNRVRVLSSSGRPADTKDLKLIDMEIQTILKEIENVKKEKEIEIQKKNDVVTYLAHDLKTPLTSIIGYLNILEDSRVPQEVQADYLQKVLDKAYHLEELTNQFFDITRFNLQEIPLHRTEIDGGFFLEQITEELYPLLNPKNLKFQSDIEQNFKIYADGNLLARVLNNLLKNAISYSDKDTVIKILGKEEQDQSVIKITNLGSMISEKELELIFEKFYRRDSSRGQSSGSGLGLAIAKEIIERHNGRLKAESVDGETTFTLILPKS
ncbi:HAMP domain-containing histidine kinase [Irregularibacter muris]|uniref:histidine kinase n=1 Tax=Irregularibacter muris TaxID=1796619 RepID=A0AAE3HDK4_9FIRM|nr:HAMP domain-containing sensor histidine kinase [Irregularibacter muris]MCR1897470.1 HAMP domain-containing histidine kinase [Irregularibacter muris]